MIDDMKRRLADIDRQLKTKKHLEKFKDLLMKKNAKMTQEQIVEKAIKKEEERMKEVFSSIIKGVDDRVFKIIGLSVDKGIAFSRKIEAKDDTEQYAYQALEDKYMSEIKELRCGVKALLEDFAKNNF